MSEEIAQRVISVIAAAQKLPREEISVDSTFEELGIDSLDSVNLLFALEEEFDIDIPDIAKEIKTVGKMVESIERFLSEKPSLPKR